MSTNPKPFPPSSQRIDAAAQAGLFPRSPLLVRSATFILIGALLHFVAPDFIRYMANTLQVSLVGSPLMAIQQLPTLLLTLALWLLLPIGVATTLAIVPAKLARRTRGHTVAPLPKKIDMTCHKMIIGLLVAVCTLIGAIALTLDSGFTFEQFLGSPTTAITSLLRLLANLCLLTGCIWLAGGMIEISLYKLQRLKDLSLYRADAVKDERQNARKPRPNANPTNH